MTDMFPHTTVSFKIAKMFNIKSGRNSILMIPKNKLLVEIDAPFVQEITLGMIFTKDYTRRLKGILN